MYRPGTRPAHRIGAVVAAHAAYPATVGNDVTAFWRAGGRVRDWVRFDWCGRMRQLHEVIPTLRRDEENCMAPGKRSADQQLRDGALVAELLL